MFLVQTRNSFVEEFVRACKDIGVNVSGIDKLKLLEQIAVQDLISLGKFLLLPTDDLSLAEVLKSPIFKLDDDDLFKLCYQRKTTLFNTLLEKTEYKTTAETLKELLNMVGFLRPFELFNYVLVKLSGRKNFVSRMGIEVEDVLDEFLSLTLSFEQSHTPSLENFITWIAQNEVSVKKEMEQGDTDMVKIMTVHGSKGLQAPIVVLADTVKTKTKNSKGKILWKNDLPYFPLSAKDCDNYCNRIKEDDKETAMEEYRRLLYVALTRAEDRLYIAGFTKNKDAPDQSWYKLMQQYLPSTNVSSEGIVTYAIPQENPFEEKSDVKVSDITKFKDYTFLLTPAPEEQPLAKPYAPSRDENDETEIAASPLDDNGNFYKRGTTIHKLLQYICTLPQATRSIAAETFLKKQLSDFSEKEILQIVTEVLQLLQTYPELFSTNSMAEVPIIGEIDGKIISGKVDRLIVQDGKVMVVDYKTNRPAANTLVEVPEIYIKQLSAYRQLLQKIYPNKTIETYLLWTNTCYMMKI
jgi:ATP-dependent helicase/nuclease subunit A